MHACMWNGWFVKCAFSMFVVTSALENLTVKGLRFYTTQLKFA